LDPEWNFEDDIKGFSPGDVLGFTVWGRDSLNNDYNLGRAVMKAEDLTNGSFDGELELQHCGEYMSFLKVQVSAEPVSPTSACDQNLESIGGRRASLCEIEIKMQQLIERFDTESVQELPTDIAEVAAKQSGQQASEVSWSRAVAESMGKMEAEVQRLVLRLERELALVRNDVTTKADEQIALVRSCSPSVQTKGLDNASGPGKYRSLALGQKPEVLTGSQVADLGRDTRTDAGKVSRM